MNHCVECHSCKQMYDVTMNSGRKNTCNKCYKKEYYEKNKQKLKQKKKEYYEKNKQNLKQKKKEYRETNKGKKIIKISQWKSNGLISDNYDQVYQLWLDSTHCDKCGCQYTDKIPKDMEHCHTTGRFRAIVCHKCNMNMLDRTKPTTNKSGHKNIYYDKREKKYKYQKTYYGKVLRKQFKTKVDALCFKYIMLLRLKAGHFD